MALVLRKIGRKEPPESKKKELEYLSSLIQGKKYVLFADLYSLPTKQLQIIKKQLRDKAIFRVSKKNLIFMALEKAGLKRETIEGHLKSGIMLIFTDVNPFKISLILDRLKVPAPAKAGLPAPKDIVIPEGDTGIRPGPMISVFGKLRIPYEVRKGSIYVKKDTVVAKKGQIISPELASLLQQLNIQPFEVGINLIAAWDKSIFIPGDLLHIDIESFKDEVIRAEREAINLSEEIAYFEVPEALTSAMLLAERELTQVLQSSAIAIDKESAEVSIITAANEAEAVIVLLGDNAKSLGIETKHVEAKQKIEEKKEEAKKEEEEKEESKEVDIGEGLSGLFGM
ncbi:MAG: 50S ribosomal protein L10 [Caldisphaeraceae archaeon]|nr:50S ribosomal protein L10 [Caldisphaeraceae archaeon]MEB3692316.1 50S ribosomal protein L10 [Caldisphaeraceae archaeon]MEB3798261.1 50S ribosomal protein L10 [Caldisphaeraceae archaeon]